MVTVRMDPDTLSRVDAAAVKHGQSRTDFIVAAIERALGRVPVAPLRAGRHANSSQIKRDIQERPKGK